MENLEKIVHEVVLEILRQRSSQISKVENNHKLTSDLGFGSLDIAQLVATLEIKLGVDPFATQVAITDIRTVGDLCHSYALCLPNNSLLTQSLPLEDK
jgi:acyl carrier protein